MHGLRIIACLVLLGACAPNGAPPDTANRTAVTIGEAVIESIDRENRELVIRGDQRTINLKAGPEIRNLDQLKVGDVVRANFYTSVAARIAEPEERGTMDESLAVGRTDRGDRPGLVTGSIIDMVVEFVSYDSQTHTVTFRDPEGRVRQSVVHPEMRDFAARREAGDLVAVTIEQAVAVSVEAI